MPLTEANLLLGIQAEGYGTDAAVAQTAILKGVWRRVNGMRRWSYLDATATSATVIGSSNVSLAAITDLGQVDAVRWSRGTETPPEINFLPTQEIRRALALYPDTGTPQSWTEHAGGLLVYPRADQVYTVTIDYTKAPVWDAANVVFPEQHQDVLVWGTVARLAFRQRDWSGVSFADAQYKESLREMKDTYGIEQRQTSAEVGRAV